MSLLKKAKVQDTADIKGGKEKDSLGGGYIRETDVYGFTVDSIYTQESKQGAVGVVLNLILSDGNKYSETFWITSGKEKGGLPYFVKDGVKNWMPSYVRMNSFVQMINGVEITEQETAERVVNIYDYEAQKEVATKVEALVDIIGAKGFVAIRKVRSNKQIKGDNGYVNSPEERFTNEIEKFFNENRQTSTEKEAGVEGSFIETWITKNKGILTDKYKQVTGVTAGAPMRPNTPPTANSAAASAPAEDDDLFGDE